MNLRPVRARGINATYTSIVRPTVCSVCFSVPARLSVFSFLLASLVFFSHPSVSLDVLQPARDEWLYTSSNPGDPEIGDMRVKWLAATASIVSILAVQQPLDNASRPGSAAPTSGTSNQLSGCVFGNVMLTQMHVSATSSIFPSL